MGVADTRCNHFIPAAHFFINFFLNAFLCLFYGSIELSAVRLAQIQQIDCVCQGSFEIQPRLAVLVHAVQALHRNDQVVIDFFNFCIMLLEICQQTKFTVQCSGIGLQVELDLFSGFCILSYQHLTVVNIHALDHFSVCKQQELRISSVIPVVKSCMNPHPEIFSVKAFRNGDGSTEPIVFIRSVPAVIYGIKCTPWLFRRIGLCRRNIATVFHMHVCDFDFL